MITYKNRQVKYRYNINAISFLIDSFIDLVESYGKNKDTVVFYKRQVNNMIQNNSINLADVKFVYDLLGINNTEAVKWDITSQKIEQFINGVHFISDVNSSDQRVQMVNALVNKGNISSSVGSLIKQICV